MSTNVKLRIMKFMTFATGMYTFPVVADYIDIGDSCNSGVILIPVLFLFLTAGLLTVLSLIDITKATSQNKTSFKAKLLSTISLVIWGGVTLIATVSDFVSGIMYFGPFLVIVVLTFYSSLSSNRLLQTK